MQHKDVKYLRDMAEKIDENNGWRVKEILKHAQRLRDIADNLDYLLLDMVEIRGLVRPIIQNAPMILEQATPGEERQVMSEEFILRKRILELELRVNLHDVEIEKIVSVMKEMAERLNEKATE